MLADRHFGAGFSFRNADGREMIGMGMGFQQPVDGQVLRLLRPRECVSADIVASGRLGIEIQDRVDNGGATGGRVG